MEQFNLDIIPGKALPVCHASQFDEGRTIRVNLYEGAAVYTLDGTETVSVSVRKPDGHVVTEGVTNTTDSYVEVVTTEQMTACAGSNLCELKIVKGGDTIGSLNFILEVEKDPLDGGDPSESFVYDLQVQIAQAVADQYDADSVIFDNTPTAGHGIGYAVTSEGIESAIPKDLDDLSDVTYTGTPAMGEAVVWDGSKWTNGTVSTVGSIDDLNDVDTTGKAEGDSLRYDSGSGDWVAKPIVIEVTQAEYDQLVLDGDLQPLTTYVITDAPNLNATAQDISYDGGADTVWDKVEANATAISGILTNISALSNLSTKVYVGGNTSKTITVTPDGASRVGYVVFGQAAQGNLSPIFYLIGGYVTASRCSVTNISGKTGVTVDASSTTDLKFVFANTTSVAVDLFFYPLFENTFTAS